MTTAWDRSVRAALIERAALRYKPIRHLFIFYLPMPTGALIAKHTDHHLRQFGL